MGVGASVIKSKSDKDEDLSAITASDTCPKVVLDVSEFASLLKVYQHADNGRVMILLNKPSEQTLGKDYHKWYLCTQSEKQSTYFAEMKVIMPSSQHSLTINNINNGSNENGSIGNFIYYDSKTSTFTNFDTRSQKSDKSGDIISVNSSVMKYLEGDNKNKNKPLPYTTTEEIKRFIEENDKKERLLIGKMPNSPSFGSLANFASVQKDDDSIKIISDYLFSTSKVDNSVIATEGAVVHSFQKRFDTLESNKAEGINENLESQIQMLLEHKRTDSKGSIPNTDTTDQSKDESPTPETLTADNIQPIIYLSPGYELDMEDGNGIETEDNDVDGPGGLGLGKNDVVSRKLIKSLEKSLLKLRKKQTYKLISKKLLVENEPCLSYKSETGFLQCNICGVILDINKEDSVPILKVKDHLYSCNVTKYLQHTFSDINNDLRSNLIKLRYITHLNMETELKNAMERFVEQNCYNDLVYNLAIKISNISHDEHDEKYIISIKNEVTEAKDILQRVLLNEYDINAIENLKVLMHIMDIVTAHVSSKYNLLLENNRAAMRLNDFELLQVIGKGSFATIFLAKRYRTKEYCAIKVMEKSYISALGMQQQILKERSIMAHAGKAQDMFIRTHGAFQTRSYLYIVMEFVQGGDCMALIRRQGKLPESVARSLIAEISAAVKYLHIHGVMHRDIKPDNILITTSGHAKLTDFSMAVSIPSGPSGPSFILKGVSWFADSTLTTNTPSTPKSISSDSIYFVKGMRDKQKGEVYLDSHYYSCPEVIFGLQHDHTIDWWGVGTLAFHLLAGKTPFFDVTEEKVAERIMHSQIIWHAIPKIVSIACRKFITSLLIFHSKDRLGYISPDEIIDHPYMSKLDHDLLYPGGSLMYLQVSGDGDTSYFAESTDGPDEDEKSPPLNMTQLMLDGEELSRNNEYSNFWYCF